MDKEHTHLNIIQGVVNRLSQNSFLLKGWSVVLIAALMALSAKESSLIFIYLAYFPLFAFWFLDGYFLWQERGFRKLYDKVRMLQPDEIDYSMDVSDFTASMDGWLRAVFSKTLIAFHGVVFVSLAVVMLALALG